MPNRLQVNFGNIPGTRAKRYKIRPGAMLWGDLIGESMICRKCGQTVADGPYCCQCGAKQEVRQQKSKSRGNGQGSVYQLKNGSSIAINTCGYYLDDDGKKHRVTVSKCFDKKKDAVAAPMSLR